MTNNIEIDNKIITLRNQQVILDFDVAELYGVETKVGMSLLLLHPPVVNHSGCAECRMFRPQPDVVITYRLRLHRIFRVALRPDVLELGKFLTEGLFVELFALFHSLNDSIEEKVPALGIVVFDQSAPHPVGVIVKDRTAPDGK